MVVSHRGFSSGTQIVTAAGSTAASAALPTALLIGGAAAGPIGLAVGAAIAGVTALLGAFGVGGGCGQSCISASNLANQVELAMKQNLAGYQAGQISGNEALYNYDQLWSALQQGCTQIGGDAGNNCISERQRGGKWDWFKLYRDPISPDTVQSDSLVGGVVSGNVFGVNTGLLIGAGLILVGLVAGGKD